MHLNFFFLSERRTIFQEQKNGIKVYKLKTKVKTDYKRMESIITALLITKLAQNKKLKKDSS